MIQRYEGNPYVFAADDGQYVEYAFHIRELEMWKALYERRNKRLLERAQRAERQVVNAARALGYVDDEG